MTTIGNTANLGAIYNENFTYYYTRRMLDRAIDGNGYDNDKLYTDAEKKQLRDVTQFVYDDIVCQAPLEERTAVVALGPYWANRSFVLNAFFQGGAYLGASTFFSHVEPIFPDEVNRRYPGMRAAAHIVLAHLIREGYSLQLDLGWITWAPTLCKFLKQQNYRVHVIHVTPSAEKPEVAAPSVGWEKNLWDANINDNGRIAELSNIVDSISFYYEMPDGMQRLAAGWNDRKVTVCDAEKYDLIKQFHEGVSGKWPL
ncbi:MAG: hypothetical protein JSS61_00290 [Verrucomicrobia bacterium]|nr:hypothetical protein [Verrucomicrobiota bacterium]